MSGPWRRRIIIVLIISVAFMLGSSVQEQLGLSFTVEGLEEFRAWVQSLGWWGPAVYIILVVFRLFIGLSSHLVLILAGLAFGVTGGIIWGSLGVVLSALVLFYLARVLGADWVHRRFGDDYAAMAERIKRVGGLAIFGFTAHPVGLLTPAHLAAGIVNLSAVQFTIAVTLAAPLRAAPYAVLGTAVLEMSTRQSLLIIGALLLVFAVPLFIPSFREWILGRRQAPEIESEK